MKRAFIAAAIIIAAVFAVSCAVCETATDELFIGRIKTINEANGTVTVENKTGSYTVNATGFGINELVSVNINTHEVQRYEYPPLSAKQVFVEVFAIIAVTGLLVSLVTTGLFQEVNTSGWLFKTCMAMIVVGVIGAAATGILA
jgi:hypothetical protein